MAVTDCPKLLTWLVVIALAFFSGDVNAEDYDCDVPDGYNIDSISLDGIVTCKTGHFLSHGGFVATILQKAHCRPNETTWDLEGLQCHECLKNRRDTAVKSIASNGAVTCADGYSLSKTTLATCNRFTNSFWLVQPETCQECTIPAGKNIAMISKLGTITCAPGFAIVAAQIALCGPGDARWNLGPAQCRDVDECSSNADGCHEDAICANTVGAYTCACKRGFRGNGFNCVPTCEGRDNPCGAQQECINGDNGYKCVCRNKGRVGPHCRQLAREFTPGCQPGEHIYVPAGRAWTSTTRFGDAVTKCKNGKGLMVDSYNNQCLIKLMKEVNAIQGDNSYTLHGVYIYYPNRPSKDYYRLMDRNGNTGGSRNIQAGAKYGRTICMRFTRFQLGCPPNTFLVFPPGNDFYSHDTADNTKCQDAKLTVPDYNTYECVQNFVTRAKLTYPQFAAIPHAGPLVKMTPNSPSLFVGDDRNARPASSYSNSASTRFRVICVGTDPHV